MASITSQFAYLDVKRGRKALEKRTLAGARIPVTIQGWITTPSSHDDGVSIEFEVEIDNLTLGAP